MSTVLITGSSGLVGSECVRHFDGLGWDVHGLDNHGRRIYFGSDGDPDENLARLSQACPLFHHHAFDIGDRYEVGSLVLQTKPDLVIHAAAQPSHDWAADHPFQDFHVNATGTLNLLEAARQFTPDAALVFLSTNKVYGDSPNRLQLKELPTRLDAAKDARVSPITLKEWLRMPKKGNKADWPGFDETLSIDQSTHSLFGCSKLAADLYVQEYGRYFGMKTTCFRCGCLTGSAQAGAEQHGFLSYLVRCCRDGRPYKVYGYKGKQVRDQLHAYDVARACEEFWKNPRCGEVYNLGGGRENGVSVLEAIELVEQATGKKLDWAYLDKPRQGDHCVYISDYTKFKTHYPSWSVTRSLADIIAELCEHSTLPALVAT